MKKNHYKFMGFLGFLGFGGFQYFNNHNIATLSQFAFFGFFSYFWINKIGNEMTDERYIENSKNAKAFTLNIAIFEFIILFLIAPLNFVTKEILTVVSALCFASLILSYAITFYRFEKM
ncbi:DUF3796 domain-containing protein [Abyssisolibacter fermentans]|uniref:DUF3796 domain-containing protein n=1 Tax=Abyssisolibacter fermentans TaxID=1766203 RepID=UPI00082B9DF9|nr:DUF3796 domain-containing protein [Abyssisolibacter fermentans]